MDWGFNDRAIYNGHKGRITSVWLNRNGDKMVRIQFDDDQLKPNEMEVPALHLRKITSEFDWYGGPRFGPPDKCCQKCGKEWKVSEHPILGKKKLWYDCVTCGTKREDYI